ncbi:MAG: 30S ribosomal protein S24e [Candidatus Micrarchaeota archaeon]|nr:30S ribosomal protein S24e [Candidatus Micrarchaeota archaeon]
MEITIDKMDDNKLLKRKECFFTVSFEAATPPRGAVKKELCSKLGVDEELAVLDYIRQGFGQSSVKCYAKVYDSKEGMGVELDYKFQRGKPKAEKEAAKAQKKAAKEAAKREKKNKTNVK